MPGKTQRSFSLRAADDGASVLHLDTEIGGWWGMTGVEFRRAVARLGQVDRIRLDINSIGGSVIEAAYMASVLREHTAHVTTRVVGSAASAASYIHQYAADHRMMLPHSELMIHSPMLFGVLSADDFDDDAKDGIVDNLLAWREIYAETYAARSSLSVEQALNAMKTESYYTASRALELGLIDEIEQSIKSSDSDASAPIARSTVGRSSLAARIRTLYQETPMAFTLRGQATPTPAPTENADETPTTVAGAQPAPATPGPPEAPAPAPVVTTSAASSGDVVAQAVSAAMAPMLVQMQAMQATSTALAEQVQSMAASTQQSSIESSVDRLVATGQVSAGERDHEISVLAALPDDLRVTHLSALGSRPAIVAELTQEWTTEADGVTFSGQVKASDVAPPGTRVDPREMDIISRARQAAAAEVKATSGDAYDAAYQRHLIEIADAA